MKLSSTNTTLETTERLPQLRTTCEYCGEESLLVHLYLSGCSGCGAHVDIYTCVSPVGAD